MGAKARICPDSLEPGGRVMLNPEMFLSCCHWGKDLPLERGGDLVHCVINQSHNLERITTPLPALMFLPLTVSDHELLGGLEDTVKTDYVSVPIKKLQGMFCGCVV